MKILNRKWWLTAAALLCLVPAGFAKPRAKRCEDRHDKRCEQVPDGGSALVYVVGAGIVCLGAMISRSRVLKANNA